MLEENVRRALEVYAYFEAKPGEVLTSLHFVPIAKRRHWNINGFQEGIEEVSRRGWLSRVEEGGWRLTDAGYTQIVASAG